MPHQSDPALLCLHAVRILGMADDRQVARRFALDPDEVSELLLDFEACGWVSQTRFADTGGWSLTESGRAHNERQLRAELDECGARPVVVEAHAAFVPLNARFLDAVTRWQVRPVPGDDMAANDHHDVRWDDRVIDDLGSAGRALTRLADPLASALARFDGYGDRYAAAAAKVHRGEHRWVDSLGMDSCHVVWMQLHEDLVATLGISRGAETSG